MKIPPGLVPDQTIWVGAGLVLFVLAALHRARARGFAARRAFAFAGWIGVAALVGGRVMWVAASGGGPVFGDAPWATAYGLEGGAFASFGGIFGAGIAAVAGTWRLDASPRRRWLDALVPAGFLGLAVARLGCVAAGCDFGTVTDGTWGLEYPRHTPVWSAHLSAGLIEPWHRWSRPVHPFPFYLVGVTILAVFAGTRVRRIGAEAWSVAAIYAAGRLVVEHWRSPLAGGRALGGWIGWNQVWALVVLAILGAVWRSCDSD